MKIKKQKQEEPMEIVYFFPVPVKSVIGKYGGNFYRGLALKIKRKYLYEE